MIVFNIITAICFAALTVCVLYVIFSIVAKKRADKISFVRGFKKGKCIAVFLIALPLVFIGYLYEGMTVLDGIFNTISYVIDWVVLKFNFTKIGALIADNTFYRVTIYYCSVLVVLNAALFALSFIAQQLWQFGDFLVRIFTRKEKLFILGNNENSLSVYNSNKSYCAHIVDDVSSQDGYELYRQKIHYLSRHNLDDFLKQVANRALKNKKYTVVINLENDEKNLSLCNCVTNQIKSLSDADKDVLFKNLRIYVFGNPKYEAIYLNIASESFGSIRYKNKYQMLAMDFVDKYPLTKFMDSRHIDYDTSLIKPNVDINVCMIGFGKPNRQIFLTSVANNQFLTQTDNGVELKRVSYHIFDKGQAEKNKNLNHLYYRYKVESDETDAATTEYKYKIDNEEINAAEYLPLPSAPASETYHHIDINDPKFYQEVREVVTKRKTDVNFVIVSFESDLENIDMAQKLLEKRREWGADNVVIFVRVKKAHDDHFICQDTNVFLIGDESECAYDIDCITNDKIYKMAQMRNEIYDLEWAIKKAKQQNKDFVVDAAFAEQNRELSDKKWFATKNQLERDSSLYGCLSLQSKLNLMNLEYCKTDDNDIKGLTEQEYMQRYAGDDMPQIELNGADVKGKKVINYTLDFPESKRKNLAVLEHHRWNSFMITKGLVPASKERIINEIVLKDGKLVYSNGRNYHLRRHGNLTTFEGLTEFRKLVAQRDNCDEIDCDVIKYDYQLLDDAYWLLTGNGYKIINRAKEETK